MLPASSHVLPVHVAIIDYLTCEESVTKLCRASINQTINSTGGCSLWTKVIHIRQKLLENVTA